MNQSPNHPFRNSLGPAYTVAESLYDNAVALSIFLDAWSKRDRTPKFTPDARDYLCHNLINAQENLDLLRQALANSLDTQEELCPANDASAAAVVTANAATPVAAAPVAPSAPSNTNGPST